MSKSKNPAIGIAIAIVIQLASWAAVGTLYAVELRPELNHLTWSGIAVNLASFWLTLMVLIMLVTSLALLIVTWAGEAPDIPSSILRKSLLVASGLGLAVGCAGLGLWFKATAILLWIISIATTRQVKGAKR